mmetsp:Transcript_33087/g.71623  ORF Transcript_33087/g.71623 Transcript_33087/m.71623 type:complete len:205 (-) Transcript_33087:627-1241(-)
MLARSSTVIHRTIITAATAPLHSSQRKKVVVTSLAFQDTYDTLTSAGLDVTRNESTEPWSLDELISQAHDAHAILAFMTDCCDKTMLDACPNLEMIACALKGFDNFDTELCAERGIAVTAVPDLLTAPTAELGLLLALGLGRRIREADEAVRSGSFRGWRPTCMALVLQEQTLGYSEQGQSDKLLQNEYKDSVQLVSLMLTLCL